jgi:CelD/BcsL family acetyltransferase involved in cellulose biosynthesis
VGAWVSETIGGAALLVRGADPEWDEPPLPASARVVEGIACPRIDLPRSDRNVGRSAGFGRQLRRFMRRLEREGMHFEWVPAGHVDDLLLSALFELHGRVRARRGVGTTFGPEQLALHRGLAGRAEAGRGPAALVATCDGAVAGVLYGFWWKDTFAAYQSGWDPRWARYSLGSVLIYQAIHCAAVHGARTFDFLRGAEAYKARFCAVDRCDHTWLVPHGPAGALLAARYRARDLVHSRRAVDPG